LLIFAVKKRRKGLDMTTLLMILAAISIGLGMGLMNPESTNPKKTRKSKKNFFVRLGETGDPVHFPK
jgi:hypothetical protein